MLLPICVDPQKYKFYRFIQAIIKLPAFWGEAMA
jgi:hypothetical protein